MLSDYDPVYIVDYHFYLSHTWIDYRLTSQLVAGAMLFERQTWFWCDFIFSPRNTTGCTVCPLSLCFCLYVCLPVCLSRSLILSLVWSFHWECIVSLFITAAFVRGLKFVRGLTESLLKCLFSPALNYTLSFRHASYATIVHVRLTCTIVA